MKKIVTIALLSFSLFTSSCAQIPNLEVTFEHRIVYGTIEQINSEDTKYFYHTDEDTYYSLVDCTSFLDSDGLEIALEDFEIGCEVEGSFYFALTYLSDWGIESIKKI